jgi:hypothetical protein
MPAVQALTGRRLGPFRFLAPLGRGAMGEVWEAEHVASGVVVALKLMGTIEGAGSWALESFGNEVRAAAGLNHPGIVRVLDHGTTLGVEGLADGLPYLVMERLHGQSLHQSVGQLSWEEVAEVLLQLLDALAHSHARGVIHRDLKPGNVLLERSPLRAVLTDFGLARAWHAEGSAVVAGTPAYMAPEQLEGRWRDQGPWTDLYALGCLAWTLIAGDPPFGRGLPFEWFAQAHGSSPLPELRPRIRVPRGVEPWLGRLLEKQPGTRTPRAALAARELRALLREPEPGSIGWRGALRPDLSLGLAGVGLNLFALRKPALVGRESERDLLWETLGRVVRRQRQEAVVISGPAGCGKSALAEWLCVRAEELGVARALRVSLSERVGLEQLVEGPLRLAGLSRAELFQALRSQGDLRDPLLGLLRPRPGDRSRRPAERHAILARFLRQIAAPRGQATVPHIVWLDQVEASRDALAFVERVLSAQGFGLPLLFVLTLRSEAEGEDRELARALGSLESAEGAQGLVLPPLPEAEHRLLVQSLLGLDAALAQRIANRSRGNPRFAVQLVGELVARRQLEPGEGGFRLRPGEVIELPADLKQAWGLRLQRLLARFDEPEARALELAAVLGLEVDREEWTTACRLVSLPPRSGMLARLYEERLAAPIEQPPGFTFLHAMFREALLDRARQGRRLQRHHKACVVLLEARDDPGSSARRGRHLLLAGQPERALEVLIEAARQALDEGDSALARAQVEYRERVLGALGRTAGERWAEGRVLQIRVELAEDELDTAEAAIAELESLARRRDRPALLSSCRRLLAELAAARLRLLVRAARDRRWGDWDALLAEAQRGVARSARADHELAGLAEEAGELALSEGQADRAIGAYELALEQHQALQSREDMASLRRLLVRLRRK